MRQIPASDLPALEKLLNDSFSTDDGFMLRNSCGELTLRVPVEKLLETLEKLRDEKGFNFDQLIDLCGVDYKEFGAGYESLFTKDAMHQASNAKGEGSWAGDRFAVVIHLLSIDLNHRLRVRVFLKDGPLVVCPSITKLFNCANWFEREAFDLFGIVFDGHPDLRRLLTDYGFIGHPFRKDFPIYGTVEMRYDPDKGRVIYQPVTIDPREVVPRVRRRTNQL